MSYFTNIAYFIMYTDSLGILDSETLDTPLISPVFLAFITISIMHSIYV